MALVWAVNGWLLALLSLLDLSLGLGPPPPWLPLLYLLHLLLQRLSYLSQSGPQPGDSRGSAGSVLGRKRRGRSLVKKLGGQREGKRFGERRETQKALGWVAYEVTSSSVFCPGKN